jgi:hypothetical protein
MFDRNNLQRVTPGEVGRLLSNDLLIGSHTFVPEHLKRVADLVAVGRDNLADGVGYHGTSLAALMVAMKTGHLPVGRSQGCAGHIYFMPLGHAELNRQGVAPLRDTPAESDIAAYAEASGYAKDLSRAALCAAILGLDLHSEVGWYIALKRDEIAAGQDIPGRDLLYQHRVTQRELERLTRYLDKIDRGFIIVLGRSAVERHPYSPGDPGEGDFKLTPPIEGLSLHDIVGIEPLSAEDFDTIEQLESGLRQ